MSKSASDLTKDEMKNLVEDTVEEKLLEWLGEPEEPGTIRNSIKERLKQQKKQINYGERGTPLNEC